MRPTFYSSVGTAGLGKENETFLMIFDVGNPCFLEENILHSGCTFAVTEPQYLDFQYLLLCNHLPSSNLWLILGLNRMEILNN
jgi:hypothetical protein